VRYGKIIKVFLYFRPYGAIFLKAFFLNTLNPGNFSKLIPHSRPTLGTEEVRRISEVINSGNIAQGEKVEQFEVCLAREIGTSGAVACSSGTAALHLVLLGMDIGPGDEVIVPSYVCSALLNAVSYVNAIPVLAEVDPQNHNIDPADVKRRLTSRTKAVIAPHLFGMPADMDRLVSFGVPVIEDCAQAVGTLSNGKAVGGLGYAAIFSFYATKVITTGEGGMVLSDSKDLLERIRDLREYDQRESHSVRYNYKMTDIQAAMGLSQLQKLHDFITSRREVAEIYFRAFEAFDLDLPPRDAGHIYYRFVIRLKKDAGPLISSMAKKGIECARPVYKPLHRYLKIDGYPVTEQVWFRSISLPIYPSLTKEQADQVETSLTSLFGVTK